MPKDDLLRALLINRLRDYDRNTTEQLRDALVARWRAEHPVAAAETSASLRPLVRMDEYQKPANHADFPDEQWYNDIYFVSLRRKRDRVFDSDEGMIQLGIASHDGSARHDWRDFQAIKNQLAGEECEAFELYPAESRLLDPSNYYTLWCFPGVRRIKVGNEDRSVVDAAEALAPQRAFGKP